MPISQSDLDRMVKALDDKGSRHEDPVAVLRERFPTVKFIRLGAESMEGRAVRSGADFALYLLDTREHCPVLTDDPGAASAVVVVKRKG